MVNPILGVDVNRQWQQYDGDLVLVDGEDNVYQAIFNRLSCRYDDMAYFYKDYGSKIYDWLCTPSYQQNLDLLADEVCQRVLEEPRVSKCEVFIDKINSYLVNINIEAMINLNGTFKGNFILNSLNNQIYYKGNEKTYINIKLYTSNCYKKTKKLYEVRVGDTLKVNTWVTNQFNEGIPIGQVDFYLGTHFIQTVDVDRNGNADLIYTIPSKMPIGTYNLIAHYRGIGRFSSSREEYQIKIVNKYTTITKYMHNPIYGVRGEQLCLPTTVKDINGGNVTEGEVYHYLNATDLYKLSTILTIDSVYKTIGDPKCVLHNATLIDGWGDPLECGLVNFYIGNGIGLMRATKSIIDNVFTTTKDPQRGLYWSNVVDETGANVFYGDFIWYLRKYNGGLKTTTTLPDTQTMYKSFNDCIFANLTDEDDLPVNGGNFDFYLRRITACKPWTSKTVIDNASILEGRLETYLGALVTDLDDFIVDAGEVDFSINDEMLQGLMSNETLAVDLTGLPITMETNAKLNSPYMKAMITDENGEVIDVGDFITEQTSNGTVSTYVSSKNNVKTDDEEIVNFKIRGNDIDG